VDVAAGAGGSQLAAFGLVGVLLAAVVLLAVALWLGRRRRRGTDPTLWAIVAGAAGIGVALVVLFVAGFRHYGGTVAIGAGRRSAACAQWWQEIGSDRPALVGDLSPTCRHDAVGAIGPAVLVAVVIGLVVALLVFVACVLLRRRSAVPR
jgi:hypothetical protein